MCSQISARCTLWVNRFLALLVAVLVPLLPGLLDFYCALRPLGLGGRYAILIGYYCCVPVLLYGAWCIDCLLRNILSRQVFVEENAALLRRIRVCCAGISLICLPASFFYPPLFFLVLIMAFLSLMVSVVKSVMAAAVELREENDLTV